MKKKFNPKQLLLFGSYARGKANEYSDVDVVVVSDTFKSMPLKKRLDVLYPLTMDLSPDFHVFGYTSEEFKKASNVSTLEDVKKHAVRIL
ncbi:nucleotidyltransferase domain-containing protein [Candidatus Gottesmanbacteria bacterium]|nr:nucleotidyltransferase domain-containing protein [Candidatus Gottesmanbacteria bacterium]